MAETTSQQTDPAALEAAKNAEADRAAGAGASGQPAGKKPSDGGNPELERQAAEQLAADEERAKAAEKLISGVRKAGRPTSAELASREEALRKAEADFAQRQAEGQRAIEARRAKGQTPEGDERKKAAFEGPVGGIWARFVGNPRASGDDDIGPPFEEMRGYSFELGGDWIFIKGDDYGIAKFQGNDHFVTEAVSVEDAEDIPDGEVRSFDRAAPRKRVGKVRG